MAQAALSEFASLTLGWESPAKMLWGADNPEKVYIRCRRFVNSNASIRICTSKFIGRIGPVDQEREMILVRPELTTRNRISSFLRHNSHDSKDVLPINMELGRNNVSPYIFPSKGDLG